MSLVGFLGPMRIGNKPKPPWRAVSELELVDPVSATGPSSVE